MAKYYVSWQHDHENCIVGEDPCEMIVNADGTELTPDESWELSDLWEKQDHEEYFELVEKKNYKWVDSGEWKKGNGKALIIRVDRKGKSTDPLLQAHMCEYQEHARERIKPPKGYMRRKKIRDRKK